MRTTFSKLEPGSAGLKSIALASTSIQTTNGALAGGPPLLASYSNGVLSVFGNGGDNNLVIGRNAAGTLQVNGGSVAVAGSTPTIVNTANIQVFGQGGNDTITLDESTGAMPRADLFGGTGNDTLTGGSGADRLFGQNDNDTLFGRGGIDQLYGGAGNDVLVGGDGNDALFGEAGNDRLIWNPGDDSDLFEGGDGIDTAEINGGNGAETFTVSANGTRLRIDRIDPAPFTIDAGTMEQIVINANGGDDSISIVGNVAALATLSIDGGAGNDSISGGNGADTLIGGSGNDTVAGRQGNDVALLGTGDDLFVWNPGDGNDVVDGQDGIDTLQFNGSATSEVFNIDANGARLRLARNVGNIVADLGGMENVKLTTLAGSDAVHVGDLTGTSLAELAVDLGLAGGTADGVADTVTATATVAGDTIEFAGTGAQIDVSGLPTMLRVMNADANDQLVIDGGAGDDRLDASALDAAAIKLTLDGAEGDDLIRGSNNADTLIGGGGKDDVTGERGDDYVLLGDGDDVLRWNPGDGSDTVEGEAGFDRLLINGANAGESINVFANGGRVNVSRDIGAVNMDLNDLEGIEYHAFGGADSVVVGDMSGTDLQQIAIDLAAAAGSDAGDGQIDTLTVAGTSSFDTITLANDGNVVRVTGLQAQLSIVHADAGDSLVINALADNDVIDASGLAGGHVQLQLNGGLGTDVLVGSGGDDLAIGGDGNDLALLGSGDDRFVWNPGDDNDTVDGQDGSDTLSMNGSNVSENMRISANGERAALSRDVANVLMDLNDVEVIQLRMLGGTDTLRVDDLSMTDVVEVRVDLAGTTGAGDGAADRIVVSGTEGDDQIYLSVQDGALVIDGLASRVVIANFDANLDQVSIEGLGGNDVIDAGSLGSGLAFLTLSGGDGDDVLIGGGASDVLFGDGGNDVLLGGDGDDLLDGGTGDDVLIGDAGNDSLANGEISIP